MAKIIKAWRGGKAEKQNEKAGGGAAKKKKRQKYLKAPQLQ